MLGWAHCFFVRRSYGLWVSRSSFWALRSPPLNLLLSLSLSPSSLPSISTFQLLCGSHALKMWSATSQPTSHWRSTTLTSPQNHLCPENPTQTSSNALPNGPPKPEDMLSGHLGPSTSQILPRIWPCLHWHWDLWEENNSFILFWVGLLTLGYTPEVGNYQELPSSPSKPPPPKPKDCRGRGGTALFLWCQTSVALTLYII